YQWRKDGVPIADATNDQIVLPHAQFSDAGRYSVAVSNAENTVTSTDAVLAVKPPVGGDLDCSFTCGGFIDVSVWSLALQPDGKVLIGGYFTTVHGALRGQVARLNTDGTTDHTFMHGLAGAKGIVNAVVVQSDGKVLIGGDFTQVN